MNRINAMIFSLVAGACWLNNALAQKPSGLPGNFPNKAVRIIIGSSPGGGTDIIARLIITKLAERWGHTFIAENMASGIGGVVAMDLVVRAPADGYTLLVSSNSAVVNAAVVSRTAAYDVRTALVPVAQFTSQPYVLGVSNSLPAHSFKELLAYVKARPGTVNYASGGVGTAAHIGMEQLKLQAGLDMLHVPYKGIGPGIVDMMAGRVHMLFGGVLSVIPPSRLGKIKALGVTSLKRSSLLPEIPSIAESGVPGFEMTGWYGLLGPASISPPIIAAINRGVQDVLRQPDVMKKLAADGAEAPLSSPQEFRSTMLAEIEKIGKLVKDAGLKLH